MVLKKKINYDQHFCIDKSLIQKIIQAANLQKEDVVLEIGPGKGILTKELAKKVNKVITVEIDTTLKPHLLKLPKNVEVVWMNALEFLRKKKGFNKIIANIPYQICEPLLQYLCTAKEVEMAVLTVPRNFVNVVLEHPVLSAWLDLEMFCEIPPEAFDPEPNVQSALVQITQNKKENDYLFLIRQLSLQRDKKVKNALRESIVAFYKKNQKVGNKKQAEKIIQQLHLPKKITEGLVSRLPLQFYVEIAKAVPKFLESC